MIPLKYVLFLCQLKEREQGRKKTFMYFLTWIYLPISYAIKLYIKENIMVEFLGNAEKLEKIKNL